MGDGEKSGGEWLCLHIQRKRRGKEKGLGMGCQLFLVSTSPKCSFLAEASLRVQQMAQLQQLSHCHPLSPLPPTVPTPAPGPSERASLTSWWSHPTLFWLAPAPCSPQHWILALSGQFTVMKVGPSAVPKRGYTSATDAGGTAPSGGDECAVKPHIGVSWDTGIIHSPELSLSPPALLGTFKTGRDKGQATKRAMGSNSALAQVLHFHTRREKPCSWCRAHLRGRCQSG